MLSVLYLFCSQIFNTGCLLVNVLNMFSPALILVMCWLLHKKHYLAATHIPITGALRTYENLSPVSLTASIFPFHYLLYKALLSLVPALIKFSKESLNLRFSKHLVICSSQYVSLSSQIILGAIELSVIISQVIFFPLAD